MSQLICCNTKWVHKAKLHMGHLKCGLTPITLMTSETWMRLCDLTNQCQLANLVDLETPSGCSTSISTSESSKLESTRNDAAAVVMEDLSLSNIELDSAEEQNISKMKTARLSVTAPPILDLATCLKCKKTFKNSKGLEIHKRSCRKKKVPLTQT